MSKPAKAYTHSHILLDKGAVSFKCSSNASDWPWLALPAFHPVLVQSINYFASVEASQARQAYDPNKWTALTKMSWQCGKPGVGAATHGVFETADDEKRIGFTLTFFDAQGDLVYRMSGQGVVFRTRDFERWRGKDKRALEKPDMQSFEYARPERLGVGIEVECFLSPLRNDGAPYAEGLITEQNGLPPSHPYLDGSGDHVNSTHLVEVGRQFVSLLKKGAPFTVLGGEMSFSSYVELGAMLRVSQSGYETSDGTIGLNIEQSGKVCASVKLECLDS